MKPQESRGRAFAMLAVVMVLWAGNTIVGRAVTHAIPPFVLALVRWVGALIVILPLAWPHAVADRAALRRGWPALLLLGLLGVAAFNGFLYSGLRHTTASNGMLMQATIPPMVLLLGRLLFGDRAPGLQVAGVTLSTLGVLTIVFHGDLRAVAGLHVGSGDGLILCGCLAWAAYTSCLRLRPAVQPESFLLATFAIGALTMLPLAGLELAEGQRIVWSVPVAGAFVYVALLPSVVAYFLYNAAVASLGPGVAGQAISLMPLLGAALAALLLNEPLQGYHGIAMAMILAGVVISALATAPGRSAPSAPRHRR